MKMKLKDYSLISNEWLDNRIAELRDLYDLYSTNPSLFQACDWIQAKISLLETIKKEQLIPSEKLAEKCFEAGAYSKKIEHVFDNPKSRFLNSKIEI